MSRYSRGYIQTHDIDWFCILDGTFPIHVGSCSGMLPSFARERDRTRYIQWVVNDMNSNFNTEWNREYISRRLESNSNNEVTPESFAENFLYFARRGFYSFYRDLPDNKEEIQETYSLIAWPKDEVPCTVIKQLFLNGFPLVFSSSQYSKPTDLKSLEHIKISPFTKDWEYYSNYQNYLRKKNGR